MKSLDLRRYEVEPPALNRMKDVQAWNEPIQNAYAQLEHQLNRLFLHYLL